ncbi:MAG: caspase family protein [Hyphomicrobiaceae bacterium]
MMRLRHAIGLYLVMFLVNLWPAAVEARQIALVVGIARYEHVAGLKNPERDAAAVADRLRDLGFEVIEAFNADRFTLERARKRFLESARGADLALFYFAGHGIQLFDRNVLIVRDANPANARAIDELGLDMTRFMADLRAAGPVRTALLIDACRDNPLAFEETVALLRRLQPAAAGRAGVAPSSSPSHGSIARRGLSNIALPTKGAAAGETLVFFAAQPGQVSYDGEGRNSFFVEGLREALGETQRPFSDQLRQVSAYVRTVTRGQQVPQLVSDWTRDIALGQATGAKVRFINTFSARGSGELSEADARRVGELSRAYPAFAGRFIAKESHAFTDSWRAASEAEQAAAKAIGGVNGFAIDYDIDRDGREETLAAYVLQTNVVLTVTDEGVTLRDSPCWDFEKDQVEAVEIALRDINGDRRPEIFLYYRNELGSWGNLCIMEYVGDRDLATKRRGGQGDGWAAQSLFRVLLRHEGAWTASLGEDNSIEICAGSNCHTRSRYTFDGIHFRMTLDQSDQPSPAKARPFRDEAERRAILASAAPSNQIKGARAASQTSPADPQAIADPAAAIEDFVANVYLESGSSGASVRTAYEDKVDYYGKLVTRSQVETDKARYFSKWPYRVYRLVPGTVRTTRRSGSSQGWDVVFEYVFEVSNGPRRISGRGRTSLTVRPTDSGFVIAAEAGEVLKRR